MLWGVGRWCALLGGSSGEERTRSEQRIVFGSGWKGRGRGRGGSRRRNWGLELVKVELGTGNLEVDIKVWDGM